MRHKIKVKQCYLIHTLEGNKPFEVRINDRDYQVGDMIDYHPLDDKDYDCYEKFKVIPTFEITHVFKDFGLEAGYVVLGIKPKENVK